MAGFKGKYEYAVDEKGRVNLPAKLRKNLAPEAQDSFVTTIGYNKSLDLFPLDFWNKFEEQLRSKTNRYDENHQFLIRLLMMNAHEISLDKQYRITIPQELLEHAGITNNVMIIGALDKIELWSPENFKADYEKRVEQTPYEAVAARVMGGV